MNRLRLGLEVPRRKASCACLRPPFASNSYRAPGQSILLPAGRFFRILRGMDVQFDSNLEARLTERAAQQGRKPDEFVQDVVARYLEEEDRFIEAVKRGEDALERGEYLTHEQVGERLRRFLHP